MLRFLPILFLYIIFGSTCFAQMENVNWLFGSAAGVSWLSGLPMAVTTGVMSSKEGCVSISDRSTGELLFYTNGKYIWDANHKPMSRTLRSGPSSTQGVIVIPDPTNADQYYIFTVPDLTGSGSGDNFCYTIVRTEPKLRIVAHNVVIRNEVAEKICVAFDDVQRKHWIIVHDSYNSAFYSYLLDKEGFHNNPVVSFYNYSTLNNIIGCMKVSPDGTMLALATYGGETQIFNSHLLLFELDKGSGLVFNEKLIKVTDTMYYVYGVAFSPDSKKLYATGGMRPMFSGDVPKIYQYEIADRSVVSGSEFIIYPKSAAYGLQLGPDDKLYVSRNESEYLSVINSPNNKGNACNYIDEAILLKPGKCALGLPNFPDHISAADVTYEICEEEGVLIGMNNGNNKYKWSPTIGLSDSTIGNPLATPYATIVYTLSVTNKFGKVSHHVYTVNVSRGKPQVSLSANDVKIFKGRDTTIIVSGGKKYLWSPTYGVSDTSSSSPILSPDSTTVYTVHVFNGGCVSDTLVKVTVMPHIVANAGEDKTICRGTGAKIGTHDIFGETTYSWSPTDGLDDPFISSPTASPSNTTKYILTAKNKVRGETKDTCIVYVEKFPIIVSKSDTICYGKTAQLSAFGGTRYEWSPKESLNNHKIGTPIAQPIKTTIYKVLVYNDMGCLDSAFVTIYIDDFEKQSSAHTYGICKGIPIQIGANKNTRWKYQWSPPDFLSNTNIAQPFCSASNDIRYILSITNEQNCTKLDTINIKVSSNLLVQAGEDKTICSGSSVQLDASGAERYEWTPTEGLNNSTIPNPIAMPKKTTVYKVKGSTGTCSGEDSITIFIEEKPILSLSEDMVICKGSSVQLQAEGAEEYEWSPSVGLNQTTISNPIASPSKTTKYYVTGKNRNCESRDSIIITVKEKPILLVSVSKEICAGESVEINTSGAEEYEWSPAEGLNRTDIANPIASPSKTTVYYVIGKNGNCENKDSVLITVNEKPSLTVSGDKEICAGESVQLQAEGADSYEWSPAEGLNRTDIANPIASPTKTTLYYVTGKNGKCENKDSILITVQEKPNLIVHNDTIICKGESVQLFASGADRYEWSPSDYLDNAFIANPISTPEKDIIYTVTGKNGDCENTKNVKIDVNQKTTAHEITLSIDTNRYYEPGSTVFLTITIPSGIEELSFTVEYDECCVIYRRIMGSGMPYNFQTIQGGFIISCTDPSKMGGVLTVEMNVNLPSDARIKEKFILKEINTQEQCIELEGSIVEIKYDPSCAWNIRGVRLADKFDMEIEEEKAILYTGLGGKTSISIYDMTGQKVWETENNYPQSTEAEILLPELNSGVYILRAQNYVWKKDMVMVRE